MELGRGMNNSLDRSKFSGGLIAAVSERQNSAPRNDTTRL